MQYFPPALEALVEHFARLPGIGRKSAQRLAFHVLSLTPEEAQSFAEAIVDARKSVTRCPQCHLEPPGSPAPSPSGRPVQRDPWGR